MVRPYLMVLSSHRLGATLWAVSLVFLWWKCRGLTAKYYWIMWLDLRWNVLHRTLLKVNNSMSLHRIVLDIMAAISNTFLKIVFNLWELVITTVKLCKSSKVSNFNKTKDRIMIESIFIRILASNATRAMLKSLDMSASVALSFDYILTIH